jgi:DNA-binding transcriptional MerR regulator
MRIGELADRLALNPKTIRYYEQVGLMPTPQRTANGYRLYQESDAERLTFIRTAQRLGLGLDDIREVLAFRDRGQAPCGHVRALIADQADQLDRRIAELQDLRGQLRDLQNRAADLPDAVEGYCHLIERHHTNP